MNTHREKFDKFKEERTRLLELIRHSQELFREIDAGSQEASLTELLDRLQSASFKVMVLGEFKKGKSTFINSLLGQEVLPAYSTPCTGVINEVKWGETKQAVLYFKNPLPAHLPDTLAKQAVRHIAQAKGGDVPPMAIPVEDIEDYVVIPDPARQNESVAGTPYSKVEIFWPLQLCKNDVEIIDSPGLNEHSTRDTITTQYLTKVDAVLFVMSCQALGGLKEMHVIDNDIRAAGHEHIFIICNHINLIRSDKEKQRIMEFAHSKLDAKTAMGPQGIFFISAIDAIEGRLDNDQAMVERSGILPVEEALTRFLTADKGRIKLLQPARELIYAVKDACQQILPARRNLLEADLATIEEKYRKIKPQLAEAEQRQRQVVGKIRQAVRRLRDDVKRASMLKLRDIVEAIPEWAEDMETENEIRLLSISQKEQAEMLCKEVIEKIQQQIETELDDWKNKEMEPMLNERVEAMISDVNFNLADFFTRIDVIKSDLSGVDGTVENQGKTAWERLAAGAAGFFLLNPGATVVGAALGFKSMLKSLITQAVLAIVAVIFGVTNPVVLAGLLLTGGFLEAMVRLGSLTKQVRIKTGQQVAAKMKEDMALIADRIADAVETKLGEMSSMVEKTLTKEIQGIREQVEAVLAVKNKGEAEVNDKKAALARLESEMQDIDMQLTEFIFRLADGKSA